MWEKYRKLLENLTSTRDKASLGALRLPHAGDWLKGEVHQKGQKLEVVRVHYGDHLYLYGKFEGNSSSELCADLSISC